MAWVWSCLLTVVLLPAHLLVPAWGGVQLHLAALLFLILTCLCCLRTRGDGWLMPFLLGLCGFLAIAAW